MSIVNSSFHKVAVIGLGLIGGSLCRALRRVFPNLELVGIDQPPVINLARDSLDQVFSPDDLENALRQVDLVFLATPINTIIEILKKIATAIAPGTLVTDVGSTKVEIVATASKTMIDGCYFIGGHPMTGHAQSGWQHADAYLFENAAYVLTPDLPAPEKTRADFIALLQGLGAHVIEMDAATHDRVAADVSHLPQLLAVALMNYVGRADADREKRLRLAAGGFRDMTRVASSPFAMWRDILRTNKSTVQTSLREFREYLSTLEALVDDEAMSSMFNNASAARQQIPQDSRGFLQPHFDIAVVAPDRPGAIAKISGALAGAEINIKDIEVMKVREGESGSLRLAFDSAQSRDRAIRLLRAIGFASQPRA